MTVRRGSVYSAVSLASSAKSVPTPHFYGRGSTGFFCQMCRRLLAVSWLWLSLCCLFNESRFDLNSLNSSRKERTREREEGKHVWWENKFEFGFCELEIVSSTPSPLGESRSWVAFDLLTTMNARHANAINEFNSRGREKERKDEETWLVRSEWNRGGQSWALAIWSSYSLVQDK